MEGWEEFSKKNHEIILDELFLTLVFTHFGWLLRSTYKMFHCGRNVFNSKHSLA